jgi:hypothetical protein
MSEQGEGMSDAEGTEAVERSAFASTASRVARWALPFVVSAALLAYLLSGMDISAVFEHMTLGVALRFVPPLFVFLAFTLWIEAICLVLVVSWSHPFSDRFVAAKIKAASYLLGLINYALGAGALTILLRRRVGVNLADAAGSVLLISLLDLLCLVLMIMLGTGLMGASAPALQAGVVLGVGGLIALGFAVLRARMKLGPLDRLRDLQLFSAARSVPLPLLLKLAGLRIVFVGSFVAMAWATLAAFDISIPWLPLVVNISILLLVSALPIAVAGLGTGQLVFVGLLQRWADPEALLAASLLLSFGLIITRSAMGLVFAREYASEALAAERSGTGKADL